MLAVVTFPRDGPAIGITCCSGACGFNVASERLVERLSNMWVFTKISKGAVVQKARLRRGVGILIRGGDGDEA